MQKKHQITENISIKQLLISKQTFVMTIFFMSSFFVYLFPFNEVTLALPILFLLLFAIKEVLQDKRKLFYSIKILLSKRLIGLSFVVPIISLFGFFLSEDKKTENIISFFMIYIIGISSQIFLVNTTKILEKMILSLYFAGVICISVYFFSSFGDIFSSFSTNIRYVNYYFHLNLIALITVGFTGAILYNLFLRKNIIVNLILLILSILIIISAQSRGSIFSMVIASVFVWVVFLVKKYLQSSKYKKKTSNLFYFVLIVLCVMLFVYMFNDDFHLFIDEKYNFLLDTINTKLALSTEDRGLNSGFTGRSDVWKQLIELLNLRILAFGNGYRTSHALFEAVDNSYLVVIYEHGLLTLLIFMTLISSILIVFLKTYFNSFDANQSALYISYLYLMVSFLANNFVARYLLAVGNPFSAFMIIFLFASPIFLEQMQNSKSVCMK